MKTNIWHSLGLALLFAVLMIPQSAFAQTSTLRWEDQGYTNPQAFPSPEIIDIDGVSVVASWQTVFDGDGGAITPVAGTPDYLHYDGGTNGATSGNLIFGLDNSSRDAGDYIELILVFDEPVTGLSFSILDIDYNSSSWDDFANVGYDSDLTGAFTNTIGTSFDTLGSSTREISGFSGVALGTDFYYAVEPVASTAATGNVSFNFGTQPVQRLRIRYGTGTRGATNPGAQRFGLSDISFDTPPPPANINCGTGSTATGSGYASSGSGAYLDSIFWLDWSCLASSTFGSGAEVTKSWDAGNGVVVSAVVTNITADIQPYTTGNWTGDSLDDVYSGVNPIGLSNVNVSEDFAFDISFQATLNGVPIPADIVMADAEDTGNGETQVWTTDGTSWQPIDRAGELDLQFSNGGNTVTMTDNPESGGGTVLLRSEDVSNINFSAVNDGGQAPAFGIMIPFDYGDAPASYGSTGAHYIRALASGGSQPSAVTPNSSLTLATLSFGSSMYLGSVQPDPETSPLTSSGASDDDTTGTDDEDGASFPALYQGGGETLLVSVTGTGGYLQGWIDWDSDGSFDPGDQIATDLQDLDGDGLIMVPLDVPASASPSSFARFRWSSTPGLGLSSIVSDGEIEDYAVSVTTVDTGSLTCPVGYSYVALSGNAETVTLDAVNGANALGTPSAAGTAASSSNSANNNINNPVLGLQLGNLVPAGAPITISVAKNNASGNTEIQTSATNGSFASQLTFNSGSEDILQRKTILAPAGGVEFMQFSRNGGSIWIDAVSYDHACAQAQLDGAKTIEVWDPTGAGLYAVPGNDVIYTITITNTGDTEAEALVLIDSMPEEVEFYNGDIDDGGPETDPVSFSQTGGAGLTFSYPANVGYSNSASKPSDFASCTYTPASGYDPDVTFICFNPAGNMQAGDPDPTFSVSFRARIE